MNSCSFLTRSAPAPRPPRPRAWPSPCRPSAVMMARSQGIRSISATDDRLIGRKPPSIGRRIATSICHYILCVEFSADLAPGFRCNRPGSIATGQRTSRQGAADVRWRLVLRPPTLCYDAEALAGVLPAPGNAAASPALSQMEFTCSTGETTLWLTNCRTS